MEAALNSGFACEVGCCVQAQALNRGSACEAGCCVQAQPVLGPWLLLQSSHLTHIAWRERKDTQTRRNRLPGAWDA
jgi:hypothetical protein